MVRPRRVHAGRLAASGVLLAVAVAAGGWIAQAWWFGRSDAAAVARAEREVRDRFGVMTARVRAAAASAAAASDVGDALAAESLEGTRRLFDVAAAARAQAGDAAPLVAVTIYDVGGRARAWAGRPSDLKRDRSAGPAALFVAPSPLGLRLVYVQPLPPRNGNAAGAVAVEHVLSPAPAASTITSTADYTMSTRVAPVTLRTRFEGAGDRPGANAFTIPGADGQALVEASVPPGAVEAARAEWQAVVIAVAGSVLALTALLLAGPLLDRRARARTPRAEVRLTAAAVAATLGGAGLLWISLAPFRSAPWDRPLALLVWGGAAAAAIGCIVSAAVRLRVALRMRRKWPSRERALFTAGQIACGAVLALLLVGFEWLLGRTVDPAAVDLRHFSLHPWSGPRLAMLAGILLCHAAVLWAGALGCVVALARWRLPRGVGGWPAAAFALWMTPVAVAAALAAARDWPVPGVAIALGGAACAVTALLEPRLAVWYRQTTVVSRIMALFVAFLLPALLVYPSVHFFVDQSTRHLIASRYSVEALEHPNTLYQTLRVALDEIDRQSLAPLVTEARPPDQAPGTESAFGIWNKTALARARLTSAIELYDGAGNLVNRFALNFPEYTGAVRKPELISSCAWDVFAEAQPFGAEERRMLHAQRSICEDGRAVGAIIVHVVWDYRTLPFISSQSPYFEVLRSQGSETAIGDQPAPDVEVVVYGWSLRPIYTSGRSAWSLDETTFARVYGSRQPFWTTLSRDSVDYDVYLSNDRAGIYAVGYPEPGWFEHFVRLAELTTLAGAGYALILMGTALFTRVAREHPHTGRALLREIRASFYRKLFLAFVLASIVPVLTLALVIRAYFANLLFDGIEGEAARTAAVAQRVIEESDALLRRGSDAIAPFGDDVMIWISQVINQDVNIFYGPELFATSERDLFASGLLPTRTPDDVYRAIVLQRLPSFVSEDSIGTVPYMLAAAPVRTGQRDAILTVPLALRQQEVEREIDELDRGIHLAALFFILLGAGIGLSMAERIADPVRRLTRATGRIAHGDFDARIAVRSSDELRRLVDAFNSMAAELKAQRAQLERTHRLEAWAEMARQVAHEIKNPLTPIQLSAEHLRRVHVDRGEPLGPVLDGCVDSILGQVRLLRQIAAEFSSFASSPTAKPAPADPVRLVHDVVEPYRAGLEGRVAIDNAVTAPLPAVFVDRSLVGRALANIVENALHAMPGKGRLSVGAGADADWVTIVVTDTGVGMDAEALDRVFEPYFSTKATGTGLGLPIARRNIELSGGSIAVASEKGRGTTVTVRLPVAGGTEARAAAGEAGRTAT